MARAGRQVEIETNGTIRPGAALREHVSAFNVSPKLTNSGVPERRRIRPRALTELAATGKAAFKFVVAEPAELDEVADLVIGQLVAERGHGELAVVDLGGDLCRGFAFAN